MPHKESPFPPKTDFYSRSGALMLAEHITAYWRAKGFKSVLAEAYAMRGYGVWGVRSNLVGGMPRGRGRPAAVAA